MHIPFFPKNYFNWNKKKIVIFTANMVFGLQVLYLLFKAIEIERKSLSESCKLSLVSLRYLCLRSVAVMLLAVLNRIVG